MSDRKVNVWRANYDVQFSSSSGMERYVRDYLDRESLVVTLGRDLTDVQNAIQASLSAQTRVTCLKGVQWLGEAIMDAQEPAAG